jgi:hypothetical protein
MELDVALGYKLGSKLGKLLGKLLCNSLGSENRNLTGDSTWFRTRNKTWKNARIRTRIEAKRSIWINIQMVPDIPAIFKLGALPWVQEQKKSGCLSRLRLVSIKHIKKKYQ